MKSIKDDFKKTKDFLVCVDSDGCLLDNMELKHKECFCPATINWWNLQSVSRYARQCAEFVNLYSRSRGFNRFPALIRTLELTYSRPEVKERGLVMPDLSALKKWIKETPVLGAAALEEYYNSHENLDPVLIQAANWSREVDSNIRHIVRNIGPFPYVKEALGYLKGFADIVVVSATPSEALERELNACGITPLVSFIAGQDCGTKSRNIHDAMEAGFDADHVLKIGDAPSDYMAAQENGVLFYPIVTGRESESWKNLRFAFADTFKEGKYKGRQMQERLAEFLSVLAEEPSW